MRVLLDTHLVLWAAGAPERLSAEARELLEAAGNVIVVSAASFWEIAIKASLGRSDFEVDGRILRRQLAENGWEELSITAAHAVATSGLPPLHKDPFDRILAAQALVEGILLLTADEQLAGYPVPVRRV